MRATHRGAPRTEARGHAARTAGPPAVRLPRDQPRPPGPPRRARRGAVVGQGRAARLRVAARPAAQPPAQGARPGRARRPLRAAAGPPAGRLDRLGDGAAARQARPRAATTARPRGRRSRSASAACCRASRRRGSTPAAASSPTCAWRRSRRSRSLGAKLGAAPAGGRAGRPRRRPGPAVPRVRARRADGGPARPRQRQRGAARLRGHPRAAARGARQLARARRSSPCTSSCCATSPRPRRATPAGRSRRPPPRWSSATARSRCSTRCSRRRREGEGRAVLIEGPPGIGKSRLLSEFRRRAGAEGALVLNARAGELEREFPFGVVRQLFEAVVADPNDAGGRGRRRARRLRLARQRDADRRRVASPPCTACTGSRSTSPPSARCCSRSTTCTGATARSLRFLAYLVRRLEGQPVLVTRLRPHRRPADRRRAAGRDRQRSRDRPRPARPAVGGGRRRARRHAPRRRARPRLPRGLPQDHGRQPAARPPAAERARDRRASSPTPRTPTSCARSARAPSRAPCCCGSRGCPARPRRSRAPSPCWARARTCPPSPASPASTRRRSRARWPRSRGPRSCARSRRPASCTRSCATPSTTGLPLGERELLHARAAGVLRRLGASLDQVAGPAHAHARGAATRTVARLLHEAGNAAMSRGAVDSSVGYLQRALEEPPPPADRPRLLLDLGEAEALTRGPDSAQHLREAYDGLTDVHDRIRAANALGRALLFTTSPAEGAGVAREAAALAAAGARRRGARPARRSRSWACRSARSTTTRCGPCASTATGR